MNSENEKTLLSIVWKEDKTEIILDSDYATTAVYLVMLSAVNPIFRHALQIGMQKFEEDKVKFCEEAFQSLVLVQNRPYRKYENREKAR